MTFQHASQLLFTSAHPLTSAFDLAFVDCTDHVLEVSVTTPASYADGQNQKTAHTSFATLILDTVMGSCVLGELERMQPIATVNLTINHLNRPRIGDSLLARARYNGESNDIAHVYGELLNRHDNSLVATAAGTFMIGTRARPLGSAKPDSAGEAV